jgi:hypothetical protein
MYELLPVKNVNIPPHPFATDWQAVIFRNFGTVSLSALAKVLKTDEETIQREANRLGLEGIAYDPVWKDKVLYFGPMGCRTGFYLLLAGNLESRDVLPLVTDCFRFIRDFRGDVPGASAKDCGNYLDMNLGMANLWGGRYADLLENITEDRLVYPE